MAKSKSKAVRAGRVTMGAKGSAAPSSSDQDVGAQLAEMAVKVEEAKTALQLLEVERQSLKFMKWACIEPMREEIARLERFLACWEREKPIAKETIDLLAAMPDTGRERVTRRIALCDLQTKIAVNETKTEHARRRLEYLTARLAPEAYQPGPREEHTPLEARS